MTKILNDATFDSEIIQHKGLALVDFWAEWCGPCKQMTPLIDQLAKDMDGKIKICKMNVDENQETPTKFMIRAIPSFLLFKNGELVETKVGSLSYDALKGLVESHL